MTLYIAIIIELLIIAAVVLLWLKDKKSFEMIWEQIIELMKDITLVRKNGTKKTTFKKKSIKSKKKV